MNSPGGERQQLRPLARSGQLHSPPVRQICIAMTLTSVARIGGRKEMILNWGARGKRRGGGSP